MKLLLEILSLADRYERRARFLPGLIVAFPLAISGGFLVHHSGDWVTGIASGAVLEILAAFVFGHLARARGKRVEDTLWAEWGGPPTLRWLRPSDTTCSETQKSKWRGAIRTLTGLTVPASPGSDRTEAQVDAVITDAVRQLRYHLRDRPSSAIVRTHNEEYGFVRNLYALRWHWVSTCLIGLGIIGITFYAGLRPYVALALVSLATITAVLMAMELKHYVRKCADRYAESLFATAIEAAHEQSPKGHA